MMKETLIVPDPRLSEIFKFDSIIFNGSYPKQLKKLM